MNPENKKKLGIFKAVLKTTTTVKLNQIHIINGNDCIIIYNRDSTKTKISDSFYSTELCALAANIGLSNYVTKDEEGKCYLRVY